MANTKISGLTALTGASLATDDLFPVVDTSATETKKITVAELKLGLMPTAGPIGGTTPSTGAFTSLSTTGNATLGDAEAADTHAIKGATTLLANSASAALTVTQTGAGNAFVVEDSASTDSTPFVIAANGAVGQGTTTPTSFVASDGFVQVSANAYGPTVVQVNTANDATAAYVIQQKNRSGAIVANGDSLGSLVFNGYDGAAYKAAVYIFAQVDGTPGTNDMPGRLVFSTTADGASTPTERMRIDSAGNVGIGVTPTASDKLRIGGTAPASGGVSYVVRNQITIDPAVATAGAYAFISLMSVAAGTLPFLSHYHAIQGALTGALTTDYGFHADTTLTGATNNYGFYSNIAAAANRYNFYANGTADNVFMGSLGIGAVPTAGRNLLVKKAITGSTFSMAFATNSTVESDVTIAAVGFGTNISTSAAAFTLGLLYDFYASNGVVGAGSAITSHMAFVAESTITNGTNNYGFYSNIAAAANRYNFYANGTAQNYFAGVTGIGVAAASTSALTVAASTTAVSSLNIPHGAAPTSPVNGDMWSTTSGLFIRINGVTKTVTLT